jgi:hypothetical protein
LLVTTDANLGKDFAPSSGKPLPVGIDLERT